MTLPENKEISFVHNLPVERWEEYRDLYVTAVKNEPLAFSETYEEIKKVEDKKWSTDLQEALDGKSVLIFAESGGKFIGLGKAHFHQRIKLKHNAFLSSLFVMEEFQGKGIGTMLINKRLALILENPDIKNVHCEIVETQKASIEAHKKLGFEITGQIKEPFFVDGKYISEYWLEKRVR